jgi:hypothetical protein
MQMMPGSTGTPEARARFARPDLLRKYLAITGRQQRRTTYRAAQSWLPQAEDACAAPRQDAAHGLSRRELLAAVAAAGTAAGALPSAPSAQVIPWPPAAAAHVDQAEHHPHPPRPAAFASLEC